VAGEFEAAAGHFRDVAGRGAADVAWWRSLETGKDYRTVDSIVREKAAVREDA